MRQLFKENIATDTANEFETQLKWARVEALLIGDRTRALEILESLTKKFHGAASLWTTYVELHNSTQMGLPQRDRIRGVYNRAIELVREDPEEMLTRYVEFETLFGSIAHLQKAE
jgi:hypothetical protein